MSVERAARFFLLLQLCFPFTYQGSCELGASDVSDAFQ
jgi:hypothetical protein